MKILHVLETSIPDLAGYTIRAKYIVEHQKKYGMEPVVVTSPFFPAGDALTRKEIINGISYYRVNFIKSPQKGSNRLASYWTRYRMLQLYKKAVFKIAEKERPDIIHAHSSYINGMAANYASEKTGIPTIYELRGLWGESAVVEEGLNPASLTYRIIWKLEANAIQNANHIITISQGIKDEILSRGIRNKNIDIVPNGVDTNFFYPTTRNDDLVKQYELTDQFVIGFIGSIRKLEGLALLIEAFSEVCNKLVQTKLLIVGDGPARKNLEELAKSLGIGNKVIFSGRVPHEEILKYYSVIDVFIYPRIDAKVNHIVTPLKPLEAMSTGKICIGSNVGGLKELITDNYNGLLVAAEDSRALADKITTISGDKELYDTLRKNSLEWIKKERDWSILIARYISIYGKLLNN